MVAVVKLHITATCWFLKLGTNTAEIPNMEWGTTRLIFWRGTRARKHSKDSIWHLLPFKDNVSQVCLVTGQVSGNSDGIFTSKLRVLLRWFPRSCKEIHKKTNTCFIWSQRLGFPRFEEMKGVSAWLAAVFLTGKFNVGINKVTRDQKYYKNLTDKVKT